MPIELYNQKGHQCLMFTDLCEEGGEVVQSNQFLIVHGDTGAIIDPGGNLAYGDLYLSMTRFFPPQQLSAILASHADPDIIASLDRWMTTTSSAKVYISRIWERFVPHFEGNFQFYDPVSRILFSGDLGASIITGEAAKTWVTTLAGHVPHMEAFHRRYIVSNKVLRLWAQMVRKLPIDMIVPQHGAPMRGAAVQEFIAWIEALHCGVDLLSERDYAVPA
jgi:flavorubredoxin